MTSAAINMAIPPTALGRSHLVDQRGGLAGVELQIIPDRGIVGLHFRSVVLSAPALFLT